MKKIALMLVILIIALALIGCSSKTTDLTKTTQSTHESFFKTIPTDEVLDGDHEVRITDYPDDGESYAFYISNASHHDFDEYVNSIDKSVFNTVYYHIENSYNASTAGNDADRYTIQVDYKEDTSELYVFSRYIKTK